MQPDRPNEIDPSAPAGEQAAAWWMLLNEGTPTAADHRAFAEWVKKSPERVEAVLQSAQLALALSSSKTRWPDSTSADELINAALGSRDTVAQLPREAAARDASVGNTSALQGRGALFESRWLPRVAAIAAMALVAVAIGLYFHLRIEKFETAIGEQRSVVLGDGSLVTLNTASTVEVRITKTRRIVTLLAGEALFQVAHDRSRPFDVTTGDTTVRAVGTQFNVDRRATGTIVTVVEGRVAVLETRAMPRVAVQDKPLEAGEQLTLSPHRPRHVVRADVDTAIAWTQRKLIFEHRGLGEVADEFNRYNRQVIEIQSEELRRREITGVFKANDPGSFLTFVSRIPGVVVSAEDSRFVVTRENVPSSGSDVK